MQPTRDEKRSLLTFYNALPNNSLTQCRIGEAAEALRTGFELEFGPEDRALGERYGILESETMVREAVQHIEEELRLRARIQRFTLRLSPLGQRLWALGEQADIR